MLDVEAALADAEATSGVVPASCVAPIQSAAKAELYDCAVIAADAVDAGNGVIPVVRHLTARGRRDRRRCGALRPLGRDESGHSGTPASCCSSARPCRPFSTTSSERSVPPQVRRGAMPMPRCPVGPGCSRATPITFGLKAAGWADALDRTRRRVATALDDALVLQFGGASGHAGRRSGRTGWRSPTRWPRDSVSALRTSPGTRTAIGSRSSRARSAWRPGPRARSRADLSLLAQTEIGEATERPMEGRGGSSTMPQKRNPVSASVCAGRRASRPGSGRDAARRNGPRSTSAVSAAGRRSGTPCPIWSWSQRVAPGRWPTRSRASRLTQNGCAPTSTHRVALCSPSPSRWHWRNRSASVTPTRASRRPVGPRRTNVGRSPTFWATIRWSRVISIGLQSRTGCHPTTTSAPRTRSSNESSLGSARRTVTMSDL